MTRKKLRNILVFGLLQIILFNIVLLVISLIFGFEDNGSGPTLLPAIVFGVLMAFAVLGILSLVKPSSFEEALTYSISWSVIVFVAILITTVANGTTNIFFGEWFNYFVFIAMAAAPILIKSSYEKLN